MLYLINKRFVSFDLSCDYTIENQEELSCENFEIEKTVFDEADYAPNKIETVDLSMLSANIIETFDENEVDVNSLYARKAISVYNNNLYRSRIRPSNVIRNFEKEQE